MALARALAPLIDLVFPPRCPLCGGALAGHGGLCAGCWGELAIPGQPACASCQRPFPGGTAEGLVCAPCLAHPPRHAGIAAATIYNAASRRLILSFKHGKRIAMAPLLGRLIAARLKSSGLHVDQHWLVVPVPLHRWRLWSRGFNQAALLAREVARHSGAQLLVDGLERHRRTPLLGDLGREARARVLAGAIRVHPRRAAGLKGASVLLVDDVLTSGATSDACIRALRRAGARQVAIACFARVLDEAEAHAQRPPPQDEALHEE
ncbi:MAG: ComF family protein [Proteobacteria bacterium]|nr:ComF family protein [Pseudomonadota bacterium]